MCLEILLLSQSSAGSLCHNVLCVRRKQKQHFLKGYEGLNSILWASQENIDIFPVGCSFRHGSEWWLVQWEAWRHFVWTNQAPACLHRQGRAEVNARKRATSNYTGLLWVYEWLCLTDRKWHTRSSHSRQGKTLCGWIHLAYKTKWDFDIDSYDFTSHHNEFD